MATQWFLWPGGAELARAALVALAFLAIFAGAEAWRRQAAPPVEHTRKAVHFLGGLVASFFPWLFSSCLTVLALCLGFGFILWITRVRGWLKSVHAIDRRSQGGIYFPVSILILFLASRDRPALYFISVLVMVVADALAALLGRAYGRATYAVEKEHKTLEGSTVFFLATFLVVELPLLLMTPLDRGVCVLVALQIALLVTCFEAISISGLDNLVVPLGAYYMLVQMTKGYLSWMALQLAAQAAVMALLGLMAWRLKRISLSAFFGLTLYFYGALSLGGPVWIVPPLAAVAALALLLGRTGRAFKAPARPLQVLATFYFCVFSALYYIANNAFESLSAPGPAALKHGPVLFAPFAGAVAAQLGLTAFRLKAAEKKGHRGALLWALLCGLGAAAWVGPLSLWSLYGRVPWGYFGLVLASCWICVGVYPFLDRLWPKNGDTLRGVKIQSLSAALGSLAVLAVYLNWIGAW